MTGSPRVTVGLPVYNGERHLAQTLESILAQDFRDLELIVSDNASTDRTGQIVAEFARRDERIRYVRSETNVGAAANYNRPVELARGAYFKWAADDDLIAPTYLSSCVAVLDADPGVVLAYGGTRLIDEAGDPIGDHRDGMHLPFPEPWRRMRAFAAHRWLCNPCFGVIRTDVLRDATTLIAPSDSSDVTFLAQVALAGRVHEVPDRLFFRRVTRDSRGLGEQSDGQARSGSARPRRASPASRRWPGCSSTSNGGSCAATSRCRTRPERSPHSPTPGSNGRRESRSGDGDAGCAAAERDHSSTESRRARTESARRFSAAILDAIQADT